MASSVLESSPEKTNAFKLMRLIVDGGTEALRNVFLNIHPGNLQHVLATHHPTLYPLFKPRNIITQPQWDKLYPHPPRIPDIQEFDISILVVLLRNICSLSAPSRGWNAMPSSTDKSREADIVRISFFRNNFFRHLPGTAISRLDFEFPWAEVSLALVRLGFSQVEIDRLKAEECGEEEVNWVREKWNESERETVVKLDEIKSKLDKLDKLDTKLHKLDKLEEMFGVQEEPARGNSEEWKWEESSTVHRETFVKLRNYGKTHPEEMREINGVRVCCSEEFLIGRGNDGTRVYVGLGKDGYERAVKCLRKDTCSGLAEQEKKILNESNAKKSNHVVNYYLFEEESDKEYLFLIMDLCEETLEDFVHRSSLDELISNAAKIVEQILKGLADLHSDPKPILHRDIKPSNLLRDVHGNWLLADFGISRILQDGARTYPSCQRGTEDWRAVESYPSHSLADNGTVRYKKESDIQVVGIVAFYIVTKGEHPFGSKPDRLRNLLDGKPVGLSTLKDDAARDFIAWLLSHDPKDRPTAEETLKHPYLQPEEQQFEMLCKMGNQQEIKTGDINSPVVRTLNKDLTDWRTQIPTDVLKYLSTDFMNGKPKAFCYKSSWTECLRLIRNVNQHWHDRPRPRPQPEAFYQVGDPQTFFLNLYPSLAIEVHRIVRSCDWKDRPDLKEFFV